MAEDIRPHISPWLATLLRPVHTAFVPAYFGLAVEGAGRIPARGPVILAPTHRSRWDPVVLPWITRRLLRSMASHDEFVGVQGWFMRRLGAFPVNTRRPSPGVFKACAEILRSGQLLVIYPEGGIFRLPPDHVAPLKPGAAWVALKVQQELTETPVPILPVRIRYGRPEPRFRTRVGVAVQAPILVSDYLDRPEREAVRALTAAIQAGLGDTVAEPPSAPRDPETGPEPAPA